MNRFPRRPLPLSLLAMVLLTSPGGVAWAAGPYSQTFSAPLSDWAVANDTWTVTSGYYRNDNGVLPTPISWYTGTTWTTNYRYKLRAYSEWPNTGNKVGLIFGVNSNGTQYFQVLVNMAGTVTLEQVSGSTVTPISGAGQPQTGFGLAADSWFDLEVFVNQKGTGSSQSEVTVRVNGKLAIVRATIAHVAGRIGLITRADKGRFDDVSVIDHGSARQVFRGNFSKPDGNTVDITTPECNPMIPDEINDEDELVCYSDILDEDASGFEWPINLWGGVGRFQYITRNPHPTDPSDPTENVLAEIEHGPGWIGSNSDMLHQRRVSAATGGQPQIPYIIRPPGTQSETPLYFRFRWKIDEQLGEDDWDWHLPWQFKTEDDTYRVSLFVQTSTPNSTSDPEGAEPCNRSGGDRTPRFVLRGDEGDSAPIYWQTCIDDIAVQPNTWMKVEIYFDRGPVGGNGRVWVAINGVRKIDRTITGGLRHNGNTNPINRIMYPTSYGGNVWPVSQWVDDIEIWTGFPADATNPHP